MSWTDIVVLNCIARTYHLHILKPPDGPQQAELNVLWESIVEAIWVDHIAVDALGLQPDLVGLPGWEPDHFLFDGGAVARTLPLPSVAFKNRETPPVLIDDLMGFQVGFGHMAFNRVVVGLEPIKLVKERKRLDGIVGTVAGESFIVDG